MARFDNENYRNWLKTTESLNTLRVGLRSFLENETETHHSSLLREFGHSLKEATCQNKCDGKQWEKKIPDCKVCIPWKDAILAYHIGNKKLIYWKNCKPHLWPKEKWEVAKVYMPQGHQGHTIYDHFDIAALLNLMGHCKHFRQFIKDQPINKVVNVRNCVMHSPDFTVSREDFQQHLNKIKDFACLMDQHAQDLKTLPSEIEKICVLVDNVSGKQEDLPDALQQKCMEMEQKALKEKIEFLAQRYEEDQDGVKEEIEGIKTFLRENEDLKEKLAPQMEQLQKRVDEHERQINVLNERVDQLEVKVTQGPKKDPLFSMNPLKYKNYVFELARKYGWREPVFTESNEDDGYRGHLEVNGLRFTGEQACPSKKLAHQEVAKKALDHLQALATSAGEEGRMKHQAEPSESSISEGSLSGQDPVKTVSQYYYGRVIVDLDTEVASEEGYGTAKEASEAAYGKLALDFGLNETKAGSSKQDLVLGHFQEHGFPLPVENSSQSPDEKFYCKLRMCGTFTFHDQEGSSKKKQAEQQAAKTALQQLSRVLSWKPNGENYKGDLKERLEALGLRQPSYDDIKKEALSADKRGLSENRGQQVTVNEQSVINMEVCSKETDRKLEDSDRSPSRLSGDDTQPTPFKEESTSTSLEASGFRYYGSVTVILDTVVVNQESHSQEGEAIESAYRKLAENLGLDNPEPGSSRAVVQRYFERSGYPLPVENVQKCLSDKISCSLKLCGTFTFLDQEGSTKKKTAEQQAAKTALQQLSKVLNWKLSGENYKGDLKEKLEALGLGQPSYDATKREEVSGSEHDISDSRSPQTIVNEFTEINMEVCSKQTDGQLEDSDRFPSRHSGDDTQTEPFKEESTMTSVEVLGNRYYGSVTIALDTTLEDKEGHSQERDAIESVYRILAESFGLDNSKPGFSRAVVQKYFERCGYPLPVENIQKCLDDKISCSLKLCGSFTFVDKEGSIKKKAAEQQAAKTALQQLSRVLNWKPKGENYKGDLKERLEALGLGPPFYDFIKNEGSSADERGHSVALCGFEPAGNSNMNPTPGGTSASYSKEHPSKSEPKPQSTKPKTAVVAPVIPNTKLSSPPVHRKQAKIQFQGGEVEKLLKVLGLLPPVVTCEKCSIEQWFTCAVSVKLEGYTFASPGLCRSKKEASRKAFHSFALATGICSPGADEMRSTQEVKQFFTQKSLPIPTEEFGGKENAFSCSLKNVSCNLVYEGQGSSEEEARQAAFQDAFSKLGLLSGISGFLGTLDKADERLSELLKMAGQDEPVSSLKSQKYKASVQLKFTDYKLEHKSNTNKKQARNYLSERILKILGVDTDASTSGSLRNSLDDWFKRKKLPEPNFEEMKEPCGVRVTFSAPFSCTSPDWEDSWEQAERSLKEELIARLSWNKEGGTAAEGSSPGL